MIDSNEIEEIVGREVYGSDEAKIGKIGQVYLDDDTGQPEWVTINTGLFGTKESFIPLREARRTGDGTGVTVPYTKDTVKDAPNVDPSAGHLSHEEEHELFAHYGLTQTSAAVGGDDRDTDLPRDRSGDRLPAGAEDHGQGYDLAGTNTDEATHEATDEAMTRSEEQLKVGTQTRESGRARLRKYVVTEEQEVTVPVTHEEVRLEREPITGANVDEASSGAPISEEEHEVTLHEEQVVVEKKAVPVEQVRLAKEDVTEQQQVSEEVRKEQIETEGIEETHESRRD